MILKFLRETYIEKIRREVNPDLLCSICFERRINTILIPCGHTFCKDCLQSYNTKTCFICRDDIETLQKIYT